MPVSAGDFLNENSRQQRGIPPEVYCENLGVTCKHRANLKGNKDSESERDR